MSLDINVFRYMKLSQDASELRVYKKKLQKHKVWGYLEFLETGES